MKVLVAIDNSVSSVKVLQSAVARAWPANTTCCVLNIVNLLRFEQLSALSEDASRESERLVKEGAKRIREAGYEAFHATNPGIREPTFPALRKNGART